jgi:hypothetical protein
LVTKWADPILGQSNKVAQPVIKRVDPFMSAHYRDPRGLIQIFLRKKKRGRAIKWADLFWSTQYRYPTRLGGLTHDPQYNNPSRIKKKKKKKIVGSCGV